MIELRVWRCDRGIGSLLLRAGKAGDPLPSGHWEWTGATLFYVQEFGVGWLLLITLVSVE